MYANNTNLTAFSNDLHSLQTILNSELNNIYQWLVANKLTLNVDKTEYMILLYECRDLFIDMDVRNNRSEHRIGNCNRRAT